MKVLITGSSGLIGSWVSESLLDAGFEILGVDWKPCDQEHLRQYYRKLDILDASALQAVFDSFRPDVVIHLAARCDLDGEKIEDYDVNITGVRNVCRSVRATPSVKRAIYTSSQLVCKVGHVPASDHEYCPDTLYGESKVKTEEIVREEQGGEVPWCIGRPTTVWGPRMSEHYQSLLAHIRKGTYFHSGGGELYKSYAYAGNIAYQYLRLLEAPEADIHGKVFYLADYEPLSLRDYANQLAAEMGSRQPPTMPFPLAKLLAYAGDALNKCGIRSPYNTFRLRNIRTEYVFDLSKTEQVCGPLPFSFDEGVKKTAEWYLNKNGLNRSE